MRPGSESQPTRPVSCGQTRSSYCSNHAMKGTPLGTSPCSEYPICDMQMLQWGLVTHAKSQLAHCQVRDQCLPGPGPYLLCRPSHTDFLWLPLIFSSILPIPNSFQEGDISLQKSRDAGSHFSPATGAA